MHQECAATGVHSSTECTLSCADGTNVRSKHRAFHSWSSSLLARLHGTSLMRWSPSFGEWTLDFRPVLTLIHLMRGADGLLFRFCPNQECVALPPLRCYPFPS